MALLLFTLAGLLESVHASLGYWIGGRPAIGYTLHGQPLSLGDILARAMPSWIVLGLLAGAAMRLAERRPMFATGWWRALRFHLPLAVLFAASFLVAAAVFRHYLFVGPESGIAFRTTLVRYYAVYFNTQFLFYWGIVGLYSAFLHQGRLRERDVQAERLQRQLTEARLDALRRQLEPHFLFNTLNAVSGLAQEGNVPGTVRTLALLGDLLRETLRRAEPVVPLARELELLDLYIAIQRVRLEERLHVHMRIDPALLDAEVPTFLLQPLVENAIRHGVARVASPGWVEIAAHPAGGRIRLTVTDSGPGPGAAPPAPGVGLANCRARLEGLYGRGHVLALERAPSGGARVTVEWPWRPLPVADPPVPHSPRNATAGSTPAARRAGSHAASSAATGSSTATAP